MGAWKEEAPSSYNFSVQSIATERSKVPTLSSKFPRRGCELHCVDYSTSFVPTTAQMPVILAFLRT